MKMAKYFFSIKLNSLALLMLKSLSMATIQEMKEKLQKFGTELKGINQAQFTIHPNSAGMIDRQCPDCKILFSVDDEDWGNIMDNAYCPSCGSNHSKSDFTTDAHKKLVKESVQRAILDNWNNNTPIPNTIVKIECILSHQNHEVCSTCGFKFMTDELASYCPCCGTPRPNLR